MADQQDKVVVIGLDAAVASLVEEYIASGDMPNLAELRKRGGYARLHSVFPGVTPVNWASVSTGAYPGTHGITDFLIVEPGAALDSGINAFLSATRQAETLWEAANKAGMKTATLNFPGAWPATTEDNYFVAGLGSPATRSPFEIRPSACFATSGVIAGLRDATAVEVVDGPDGAVAAAKVHVRPDKDDQGSGPELNMYTAKNADGEPGIFIQLSGDEAWHFLAVNQWSQWFKGEFAIHGETLPGTMRFKLAQLSEDMTEFALYCSQVMSPTTYAQPVEIGQALLDELGPFLENCGARGYDRDWVGLDTYLEEGEYKGMWLAKAARTLIENHDRDAVFLKWHFLDHIQHSIWGHFDPVSAFYNADEAAEYEEVMRRSYEIADGMIGELLPLLDKGVTVVVVSDHGHTPHLRAMSLNNLLAEKGLIVWEPNADGVADIDWSQTKAFGGPALGHIRVNLQGRDPEGIVPPEEYEQVRDSIIQTLLSYQDPDTGQYPVAAAITRENAVSFGMWGDRVGDVVYLMAAGYTGDFNWSPLTPDLEVIAEIEPGRMTEADYGEGKFIATKFQSAHGCGFPNAALGKGTEEAMLCLAGAGIKANTQLAWHAVMVDVAPTIAASTRVPLPGQSEGRVLHEFMNGKAV